MDIAYVTKKLSVIFVGFRANFIKRSKWYDTCDGAAPDYWYWTFDK
jgi:hypothetical protein